MVKASENEKLKVPTKVKKVNVKKDAGGEDPSSLVKTADHQYPFVYNGQTYYCKQLPANFQSEWDGICEMRKSKDAPVDTMVVFEISNNHH